jgi:hypothetical protein
MEVFFSKTETEYYISLHITIKTPQCQIKINPGTTIYDIAEQIKNFHDKLAMKEKCKVDFDRHSELNYNPVDDKLKLMVGSSWSDHPHCVEFENNDENMVVFNEIFDELTNYFTNYNN